MPGIEAQLQHCFPLEAFLNLLPTQDFSPSSETPQHMISAHPTAFNTFSLSFCDQAHLQQVR